MHILSSDEIIAGLLQVYDITLQEKKSEGCKTGYSSAHRAIAYNPIRKGLTKAEDKVVALQRVGTLH